MRIEAADCPRGSFRYHLIKLMTSLDTRVKRVVSELMWVMFQAAGSQANLEEFVRWVGIGSAAHILHLKKASLARRHGMVG